MKDFRNLSSNQSLAKDKKRSSAGPYSEPYRQISGRRNMVASTLPQWCSFPHAKGFNGGRDDNEIGLSVTTRNSE